MIIIKDNIDKISLGELGLVNHDEKRIWGAMLPEIRKHLDGESSIFDGIQCNLPFEGYTEAGNALLESSVIDPCLDEYWVLNEKGAYTFEWTENDVREFKEYMKARWSYMMWLANEAMNGTLNENLTYKSAHGTTWDKILDDAWERDFIIVRMLCGDLDESESSNEENTAHVDDNDSFPELPF